MKKVFDDHDAIVVVDSAFNMLSKDYFNRIPIMAPILAPAFGVPF
jgi:hypothetical protein